MSGRSLGCISVDSPGSGILGACLGGLWGISGGLLEVSGRSLGSFWEVSGKSLGGLLGGEASRRLQKGLDSKSDAILSENVKKFPRGLTLLCVLQVRQIS